MPEAAVLCPLSYAIHGTWHVGSSVKHARSPSAQALQPQCQHRREQHVLGAAQSGRLCVLVSSSVSGVFSCIIFGTGSGPPPGAFNIGVYRLTVLKTVHTVPPVTDYPQPWR